MFKKNLTTARNARHYRFLAVWWLFACQCSDAVVPANSPEALRYAEAVCGGLDRCGCPERFESAGACRGDGGAL